MLINHEFHFQTVKGIFLILTVSNSNQADRNSAFLPLQPSDFKPWRAEIMLVVLYFYLEHMITCLAFNVYV